MKKLITITPTGQALVTLLFFVVISVTLTSAAVVLFVINAKSATRFEQSTRAYFVAESGIENALIRLLRDPTYVGDTLPVDDGSAVTTVTANGATYTIQTVGSVGTFKRTIQVTVGFTSGRMDVSDWKEI